MITDTHAHLFWKDFDEDRADVLARARSAGVERMVVVGGSLDIETAPGTGTCVRFVVPAGGNGT